MDREIESEDINVINETLVHTDNKHRGYLSKPQPVITNVANTRLLRAFAGSQSKVLNKPNMETLIKMARVNKGN